jgi:hypothetical protein
MLILQQQQSLHRRGICIDSLNIFFVGKVSNQLMTFQLSKQALQSCEPRGATPFTVCQADS